MRKSTGLPLICFAWIMVAALFAGISVQAASEAESTDAAEVPVTVYNGMNWNRVYDFRYYMGRYPELMQKYGQDPAGALAYFVQTGMQARQQASAEFDIDSYIRGNADLRRIYGNNWAKYYRHYQLYGWREPRVVTAAGVSDMQGYVTVYGGLDYARVYDYNYYVRRYPGIYRTFGPDDAKTLEHFVKWGTIQLKQGHALFNVVSYRNAHPDLRRAYGVNYLKYYQHYVKYGWKESSRTGTTVGITSMQDTVTKYRGVELSSVYDYAYFIKRYPDVVKKTTDDDAKVLQYFATYGIGKNMVAKDPGKYPDAKPGSANYEALKKKLKPLKKYPGDITICLDPGHQRKGDSSKEPIGPGASKKKAKCSSGAYGHYSKKNEYEINLEVALKLRTELQARGYKVVLTRTTHDVNLSNIERAQIANKAGADITIRIHANDIKGSSLAGVLCYGPGNKNPYLSADTIKGGQRLAVILRDSQAKATGQKKQSNLFSNDMTGINWCKGPCAIVEMGFMSNRTEDLNLAKPAFQTKIASGLANGVDEYFAA